MSQGHSFVIDSIPVEEFKSLICPICGKKVPSYLDYDGTRKVLPRHFFENSAHGILVAVHKKCKRTYLFGGN